MQAHKMKLSDDIISNDSSMLKGLQKKMKTICLVKQNL